MTGFLIKVQLKEVHQHDSLSFIDVRVSVPNFASNKMSLMNFSARIFWSVLSFFKELPQTLATAISSHSASSGLARWLSAISRILSSLIFLFVLCALSLCFVSVLCLCLRVSSGLWESSFGVFWTCSSVSCGEKKNLWIWSAKVLQIYNSL